MSWINQQSKCSIFKKLFDGNSNKISKLPSINGRLFNKNLQSPSETICLGKAYDFKLSHHDQDWHSLTLCTANL